MDIVTDLSGLEYRRLENEHGMETVMAMGECKFGDFLQQSVIWNTLFSFFVFLDTTNDRLLWHRARLDCDLHAMQWEIYNNYLCKRLNDQFMIQAEVCGYLNLFFPWDKNQRGNLFSLKQTSQKVGDCLMWHDNLTSIFSACSMWSHKIVWDSIRSNRYGRLIVYIAF